MTYEVIPEDIKQFIIQNIDSVAQWEALLLLRNEPHTEWSLQTVAGRLYIREPEAEMLLNKLHDIGFISIKTTKESRLYIYEPHSEEIKNKIDKLAELYDKYLIPVTSIIHTKSANRIQQFADAFRIRKDK